MQHAAAGDDLAKGITVMDIEHVKMSDLSGMALAFLKKTIGWSGAHYPERYGIRIKESCLSMI
jgi:hypothetical protein